VKGEKVEIMNYVEWSNGLALVEASRETKVKSNLFEEVSENQQDAAEESMRFDELE
jgi:hypothetical protein